MTTVEVEAPSWLHRFIIGQNGQNIKDITQDLPHVMVTFPKDTDKIVIEGPPDEVQCARESFERFTTKLVSACTCTCTCTCTLTCGYVLVLRSACNKF